MTAHFNKEIPFYLRTQLIEIGLNRPISFVDEYNGIVTAHKVIITYGYAFDFLFEKGYLISISKDYDLANECFSGAYDWSVDGSSTKDSDAGSYTDTWFEAANKAIESCIDLINKKSVNNE